MVGDNNNKHDVDFKGGSTPANFNFADYMISQSAPPSTPSTPNSYMHPHPNDPASEQYEVELDPHAKYSAYNHTGTYRDPLEYGSAVLAADQSIGSSTASGGGIVETSKISRIDTPGGVYAFNLAIAERLAAIQARNYLSDIQRKPGSAPTSAPITGTGNSPSSPPFSASPCSTFSSLSSSSSSSFSESSTSSMEIAFTPSAVPDMASTSGPCSLDGHGDRYTKETNNQGSVETGMKSESSNGRAAGRDELGLLLGVGLEEDASLNFVEGVGLGFGTSGGGDADRDDIIFNTPSRTPTPTLTPRPTISDAGILPPSRSHTPRPLPTSPNPAEHRRKKDLPAHAQTMLHEAFRGGLHILMGEAKGLGHHPDGAGPGIAGPTRTGKTSANKPRSSPYPPLSSGSHTGSSGQGHKGSSGNGQEATTDDRKESPEEVIPEDLRKKYGQCVHTQHTIATAGPSSTTSTSIMTQTNIHSGMHFAPHSAPDDPSFGAFEVAAGQGRGVYLLGPESSIELCVRGLTGAWSSSKTSLELMVKVDERMVLYLGAARAQDRLAGGYAHINRLSPDAVLYLLSRIRQEEKTKLRYNAMMRHIELVNLVKAHPASDSAGLAELEVEYLYDTCPLMFPGLLVAEGEYIEMKTSRCKFSPMASALIENMVQQAKQELDTYERRLRTSEVAALRKVKKIIDADIHAARAAKAVPTVLQGAAPTIGGRGLRREQRAQQVTPEHD